MLLILICRLTQLSFQKEERDQNKFNFLNQLNIARVNFISNYLLDT